MKIYLDGKQIEEPCVVTGPYIVPFTEATPDKLGILTIGDEETPVWIYPGLEYDRECGVIHVVHCQTMPPTAP